MNQRSNSILVFIALFALAISFGGCSTKRNTWLSRNYQKMTSHFNVYFNAREAFTSGLEAVRTSYRNDYSHVLPVYEFSSKQASSVARGDMETCLKKSHKLVQLHSITVKPEAKSSPSEADKRFRAKEEFNPYVPEGYLLMGKANVLLHETEESIKYFDYLSRKHSTDRPAYEAKIWKAILCANEGRYTEAQQALKSYDMDGIAPANLYPEFQAAYANIYICQEDYQHAIPYMERAVAEIKDRHARRRYTYILAQLYRATGAKDKAAPLFMKLSRNMQDFDMAFAARLDLATVATTPDELLKAEKTLQKMVADEKYAEQQDQIYYAIAHIEQSKGNEPAAIAAFNNSVQKSVSNDNQKGLSFLALADIYQSKPLYIDASTSLDSASTYLSTDNMRKKEADERASLLAPLAKELRTIRDNDSLLRIAQMDEKSRNALIEKMVSEDRARREAEKAAREADEENGMSLTDYNQIGNATRGQGWYFYNTSLVNAGKSTFRTRWGRRPNEDNWRRSDKSQATFDNPADKDGFETTTEQLQEELTAQADGPMSVQNLMSGLPLSPEAQQANLAQTEAAYLQSAIILYDNVKDYDQCVVQLNEMLRRFPNSARRYDALTLLHFAQMRQGDKNGQSATDRLIATEYPQSDLARALADPSYAEHLQDEHNSREQTFRSAYEAYIAHRYDQVQAVATRALQDSQTDEHYRPRYLLLRAMSGAKQGNATAMRSDLTSITEKYAGTEQDSIAKILLAKLDEGMLPVRHTIYDSPLDKASGIAYADSATDRAHYVYQPDSAHVIVCVVDNGKLKEAQFSIADYNFSNYILQDYDLAMQRLPGDKQIIVISPFADRRDATTYFYALREQKMWRNLTSEPLPLIYMMSLQNYHLLTTTGIDRVFLQFVEEHYVGQQP